MNNIKRGVAFYLRSATGDLADLKIQMTVLEGEFVKRGFDLNMCSIEVYTDEIVSGRRPGPEFNRMCDDIAAGRVSVVMVERMNRVSRSLLELLKFRNLVTARQIRFISVNENVDSSQWNSASSVEKGTEALERRMHG